MTEANYGYIQFEGIEGESGDSKHTNWTGFSNIGIQTINPSSIDGVSGLSAGTPQIDEIRIAFELEKAYITMRKFLLEGKHIKTTTIEIMKRGEAKDIVWQKIVLTNALIVYSSISISLNYSYCQLGIDFEKYEETYTGQKADGTADAAIKHGYDRYTNEIT
ncbi:type VI secretion system tube protein Hcp [Xenorhabdus lircayensis]|uniref:Type VI secretion system tube protein Hcp n=1 Tax=Xenorhabdus lircayensis TaxID=2763499 RepID=A0ABS0U910_9GAMM|nr:type VI secretion system tube protein Hcp [Xenorhabdus lircayensis]MBI6550364.1 type VI secretion system tube protein Hcp [Xenorhabdus lircayensis]